MVDLDGIVQSLKRPATVATVGGVRPPDDPITSWLGQVRLMGRNETWPSSDGQPMAGVCQVVVAELPVVPPALADIAVLSLFMRVADGRPVPPSEPGDGGWEIRTYPDLTDLALVEGHVAPAIDPLPVRWSEAIDDLPAWEDASAVLDDEQRDAIEDQFHDLVPGPVDGFKVGGWPSLIQGEIYWAPWNRHPAEPAYALQIDSDAKTGLAWGDAGCLYLGRGTADPSTWAVEWQCM